MELNFGDKGSAEGVLGQIGELPRMMAAMRRALAMGPQTKAGK
jgi:hypothetical protein